MKPLKFSHITKTCGTSIENLSNEKNIKWGRFDNLINKNWHSPIYKFNLNEIKKYDWFIVVRNPYDRILSEYHCKWGGVGNKKITHSKEEFNQYIRNKINIINKNKNKFFGHYLPQHLYLYKDVKMHILKFENISNDFNQLMKKYKLNLQLNKHDNKNIKIFSINDFDNKTITLINQVYDKDFKLFGYKKIQKN